MTLTEQRDAFIASKKTLMNVVEVRDKLLAAQDKYGDLQVLDAPPELVEAMENADFGPPVYVSRNSLRGHADLFLGEPTHVPDYNWGTGNPMEPETRTPISERQFSVWGVHFSSDGQHALLPGSFETDDAGLSALRRTYGGARHEIYWSDATDAEEALVEATEAFARSDD